MRAKIIEAPSTATIRFMDCGQDFLEWDIDVNGVVTDCRPFQSWLWNGTRVVNHEKLRTGSIVKVKTDMSPSISTVKYPVRKITRIGGAG